MYGLAVILSVSSTLNICQILMKCRKDTPFGPSSPLSSLSSLSPLFSLDPLIPLSSKSTKQKYDIDLSYYSTWDMQLHIFFILHFYLVHQSKQSCITKYRIIAKLNFFKASI